MKSFREKLSNIKSHFRFVQGLALGLSASSLIGYAVVTINTFTPGTTISSADVNANFANLKAAVDTLQEEAMSKVIGTYPSNQNLTCTSGPTFPGDFISPSFEDENGNPMATYIIPVTGYYEIRTNWSTSGSVDSRLEIVGVSDEYLYSTMAKHLNQGDELKIWFGCYDKGGSNPSSTLNSSGSWFLIKKL